MRFSSLSFMGVNFDHTWYNFETLSLMDGKVVPLLKFNKIILLIVRVLTTNATHIISNYYIKSGYYNAKWSLIILGGCKCMRMWEYLLKNALYDSNSRTVFITQKFDWRKGQLKQEFCPPLVQF